MFKLADDEDRSDNGNKTTAKNFLAGFTMINMTIVSKMLVASQFFEVAKQFGELNDEVLLRLIKYYINIF